MKRSLLFGLAIAFLFFSPNSSEAQNKYNELELTGEVLTVETLSTSNKKIDQIPQKFIFTKEKEMILMINFSQNSLSGIAYDKFERPLLTFQDEFENITGEFSYDVKKKTFEYKQGKNLTAVGELNDDGQIISFITVAEEKNGPLKLKNKKQMKQVKVLEYDSKGNQTVADVYLEIEGTRKSILKVTMAYNEKNQKIFEKREQVDRKDVINERTFTYDDRGFLIEIKGVGKTNNEQKDLSSFTFIYDQIDDKGNWLKRRTFFKEQEIRTETRTIQYHE